jgi:ATP-dependent DNA helicase RecQ
MKPNKQLQDNLRRWFGFETFRPGQEEVIKALLNHQDTLALLPTGTGKTLLYQYFGKMTSGIILIVSPLISLMQDQVDRMKYLGEKKAVAITSNLSWHNREMVLNALSHYHYVYVSPEMLSHQKILSKLKKINISLMVIDEAHCINQWGPDFRPDYLNLKEIIKVLEHPLMLLLTATASSDMVLTIQNRLGLKQCKLVKQSVNRSNIMLSVNHVNNDYDKNNRLLKLVIKLSKPGIIYFSSKRIADEVCEWLKQKTFLSIEVYHADLDAETRYKVQHQFINDQIDIICATSAFGMGIDKSNVRFIIHYHMPSNMESYVQEMGRAGRDGLPSISVVLYRSGDENLQRQLIDATIPNDNWVTYYYQHPNLLRALDSDNGGRVLQYYLDHDYSLDDVLYILHQRKKEQLNALRVMKKYIMLSGCRRAYLLNHFNERYNHHDEFCCDGNDTILNLSASNLLSNDQSTKNKRDIIQWQDVIKQLFKDDLN